MGTYLYQIPIDWRRVHFSITHPNVTPAELQNVTIPAGLSLLLPTEEIKDVREVRNWLHDKINTDGKYDLLGCYRIVRTKYQFRSTFRGIIVVFLRALDVVHFRLCWNTMLPSEI